MKVIHLKGFGSGILPEIIQKHHAALSRAIEILNEYDVVVFDGDPVSTRSFTGVFAGKHLCYPLPPLTVKYVVTFHTDEKHRRTCLRTIGDFSELPTFNGPDGEMPELKTPGIYQVIIPGLGSWEELGVAALGLTGGKEVLAIGGGKTVKAEYDAVRPRGIRFRLIDVCRCKVPNTNEPPSLRGVEGVEAVSLE